MRLFVAIDLPEVQKGRVQTLYPLPFHGAKALPLEQLHLTLRFIGEADEKAFASIRDGLQAIRFSPFPLQIRGTGVFPNTKRPRVLWLGLSTCDGLLKLQKNVEAALFRVGLSPEDRPFSPHLTLARFRYTKGGEVEDFLRGFGDFSTEPWEVREFHLYSSVLDPKGAIHTREQSYPSLPSPG